MASKIDARQIRNRSSLPTLSNNADVDLDDILQMVNDELVAPLRLVQSQPADRTLTVESIVRRSANTNSNQYGRTISPISGVVPPFVNGTIVFPAVSGGTVSVSPGSSYILTIADDSFKRIVVSIDKDGQLHLTFGTDQALRSDAEAERITGVKGRAVGHCILSTVGSVVQNIVGTDISQYASGGGDGGSTELDFTAGEDLLAGEAIYISIGNAGGDVGRTAGLAYKLECTNDYRCRFSGIVVSDTSSGDDGIASIAGVLEDIMTGLTVGGVYYADLATPGGHTTSYPTTSSQWIVPVFTALSTTSILISSNINGTANVYIEATDRGSQVIADNQVAPANVTDLLFSGAVDRSVIITYSVYRSNVGSEASAVGTIYLAYETTASAWLIDDNGHGDDTGVDFDVTAGGQLTYISSSMGGPSYSGVMKWNILSTTEV